MTGAQGFSGASAGMDALSGVFGYLDSLNAASIANSRAEMMRMSAEADAQRYAEMARAQLGQRSVMYLASGVTLAGSPLDSLDTSARIAQENVNAIRMHGEMQATDEQTRGSMAEMQGRTALLSGLTGAGRQAYMGFGPKPRRYGDFSTPDMAGGGTEDAITGSIA